MLNAFLESLEKLCLLCYSVTMLESRIEHRLVDLVRSLGGWCVKMTPAGQSSFPDRIVLLHGVARFVELKRPGETSSPAQRACQQKLRKLGFQVDEISTMEQLKTYVDEVLTA